MQIFILIWSLLFSFLWTAIPFTFGDKDKGNSYYICNGFVKNESYQNSTEEKLGNDTKIDLGGQLQWTIQIVDFSYLLIFLILYLALLYEKRKSAAVLSPVNVREKVGGNLFQACVLH